MATYTRSDYIANNDLLACYHNFQRTTARWKNHWWSAVEEIFNSCADWAKQFIIDTVNRTLTKIDKKIIKPARRKYRQIEQNLFELSTGVIVRSEVDLSLDVKGEEKNYCFWFKAKNVPEGKFTKVGTSAKSTCFERLRDEVKYYNERGLGVEEVVIKRIYNCGDVPAEGFESFCRAKFIKKYPGTYHKNDRFFGVEIPVEEYDKLWKLYGED